MLLLMVIYGWPYILLKVKKKSTVKKKRRMRHTNRILVSLHVIEANSRVMFSACPLDKGVQG